MTVKEVRDNVEKLTAIYDGLGRLQNLCLAKTEQSVKDSVVLLEEQASLHMGLRSLCSVCMQQLSDDIKRVNKLIDNTIVSGM